MLLTHIPAVLVASGLLVGYVLDGDKPLQEDHEAIRGTWRLISREYNGNKVSEDEIKQNDIKLQIGATAFSSTTRGDTTGIKGTYRLQSSESPKQIDFRHTEGPAKGELFLAIYSLEKDRLTICLGEGRRPPGLAAPAGTTWVLAVYERVKK